jgi:RimJ/RimL family protein N-acetyltransferase
VLRSSTPDEAGAALAGLVTEDTFRYYCTMYAKGPTEADYSHYWAQMQAVGHQPYLIEWQGRPVGQSCFMDHNRAAGTVEIGMTWYAPEARGTVVNPTCKLLMLQDAFDHGLQRVTLKCDARNERSRRAILGIGATYEGTLRCHHYACTGESRDTAMFSVIASEWPSVREQLEQRIGATHAAN